MVGVYYGLDSSKNKGHFVRAAMEGVGFIIGLSKNLPIIETIKLASAISAANALRIETGF